MVQLFWVESEDHSQFRACIYEYSDGSNAAAELNWIALESAPFGHRKNAFILVSLVKN